MKRVQSAALRADGYAEAETFRGNTKPGTARQPLPRDEAAPAGGVAGQRARGSVSRRQRPATRRDKTTPSQQHCKPAGTRKRQPSITPCNPARRSEPNRQCCEPTGTRKRKLPTTPCNPVRRSEPNRQRCGPAGTRKRQRSAETQSPAQQGNHYPATKRPRPAALRASGHAEAATFRTSTKPYAAKRASTRGGASSIGSAASQRARGNVSRRQRPATRRDRANPIGGAAGRRGRGGEETPAGPRGCPGWGTKKGRPQAGPASPRQGAVSKFGKVTSRKPSDR